MNTVTLTSVELAEVINRAINAGAEEFAKAAGLPQVKFQSIALGLPFKQARNKRRAEIVESKIKEKG